MQLNVLNDLAKAKRRWTEKKCHTEICEPGINKSTMRKPRLPQPGASRSQSAAARATFSQIVGYDPEIETAPNF